MQGLQRDVVKLTQRGFHLGGPALKNKVFVFGNYEQYILPGTKSYTRTILTSDAMAGNFSYCPTGKTNKECVGDPSLLKKSNVYSPPAAHGLTNTPDPTFLKPYQAMFPTAAGRPVLPRRTPPDRSTPPH